MDIPDIDPAFRQWTNFIRILWPDSMAAIVNKWPTIIPVALSWNAMKDLGAGKRHPA
jgi:hypothetical protein